MTGKIFRIYYLIVYLMVMMMCWPTPAMADTTYTGEAIPIVQDGDFAKLGRILVTGTTTLTFTGEYDRAEFRLPPYFYITSTGIYDQADSDCGVKLMVMRGFTDPSAVKIRPIAEDPYNPGHYGGFELIVDDKSGWNGYKPEMMLYFDHVYVPRGFKGYAQVTVEPGEKSGFSKGTVNIAQVEAAKLDLKTEKMPSLVADQRIGPIVISENIGGAFKYIEFSLPAGIYWEDASATIDPGLGLVRDYDNDNYKERDYSVTAYVNKYGYSVLRVELQGAKSDTKGTLRLECAVMVDESIASHGDVHVTASANVTPLPGILLVANYNALTVAVTAEQPKQLYGGLFDQEVANITITENAPGALIGGGRMVTLELPRGASWASEPTVQIEGVTELVLRLNKDRAFLADSDHRTALFYIAGASKNRAGKIIIKEAKVDLSLGFDGELKVTVGGGASATGEVVVGNVSPSLLATATNKPELLAGRRGQPAGDINIKEPAGRVLLARELWVDFPSYVYLGKNPVVQVSEGNLIIGEPLLNNRAGGQRLIIPVKVSSSQASTLHISGIMYDIHTMVPYGDTEVLVGGPAINEANQGRDWAASVVNATIVPQPENSGPDVPPAPITAVFKLDDQSYQVNGQVQQMDVAPFVKNERIYLPLRYIGLALGVDEEIGWDQEIGLATLFKGNLVVQVKLGESAVYRQGVMIPIDAPALAYEGRIMVSLRAVATAFGAELFWDNDAKTVTIS